MPKNEDGDPLAQWEKDLLEGLTKGSQAAKKKLVKKSDQELAQILSLIYADRSAFLEKNFVEDTDLLQLHMGGEALSKLHALSNKATQIGGAHEMLGDDPRIFGMVVVLNGQMPPLTFQVKAVLPKLKFNQGGLITADKIQAGMIQTGKLQYNEATWLDETTQSSQDALIQFLQINVHPSKLPKTLGQAESQPDAFQEFQKMKQQWINENQGKLDVPIKYVPQPVGGAELPNMPVYTATYSQEHEWWVVECGELKFTITKEMQVKSGLPLSSLVKKAYYKHLYTPKGPENDGNIW